jgi:hypothetical protein
VPPLAQLWFDPLHPPERGTLGEGEGQGLWLRAWRRRWRKQNAWGWCKRRCKPARAMTQVLACEAVGIHPFLIANPPRKIAIVFRTRAFRGRNWQGTDSVLNLYLSTANRNRLRERLPTMRQDK